MKFTVAAFMFLICSTALLSTAARLRRAGGFRPIYLRCYCTKTHSNPPIPIKKIISLKGFPPRPQCKKEEIIAKLKKGYICLHPNARWVRALREKFSSLGPQFD